MAPKKGGGGSSGGGSSGGDEDYDYDYGSGSGSGSGSGNSDDYDYDYGSGGSNNSNYNPTVGLASSRWKDSAVNALFAMNIITILVLILYMILTMRFKWIREKGTDKLRNSGYFFAAFCVFSYLLIVVIRTAMIESGYHATSHFLTALVFERFFYLVGDIMIVAIIARTILEDMGSGTGKLASFSNGLIGLLWMLAIIAFNFYAAFCGQFIAIGGVSNITNEGSKYTAVFYSAYIFVISMYLAILACMAVIKRRSKSRSMATAIVSAGLADSFMYDFTTISIFLVVAIIGGLRQRHSEGGMSQEQKIGLPGHHYVPLGPYGPPPAPYDAQAPVGNYPQPVQSQPVQYAAPEQNAALGKLAPQPQQVPISSYAAQGQYVAPVQPTSTAQFPPPGQYAAPVQPVQYAPPVQYAGSGQYVPQGMNTTPTIRSVSPLHAPVAMSTALAYTGTSSSVSPPPPHDSYQFHMSPHH